MKTNLQVDSLKLTVRGVPANTATAALQGLAPALARELGQRTGEQSSKSATPAVSRNISETALRNVVAAQLAGALRPHTNPNR